MKRLPTFIFAISMIVTAGLIPALQAGGQTPPPLAAQVIKPGLYWVEGGAGANTGFWIGKDAVVVIDAKMTPDAAREMLAKIKELTPNPVQSIVLTHSDGDHVNGLTGFPQGLKILSQETCKTELEAAFTDPALRAYLPTVTFKDRMDLLLPEGSIRLLHFGSAHTSGDAIVLFPAEKVAFIGDLAFIGRDPLIHKSKGGTSFGLTASLKSILALEADTFIPGHGKPLAKSDIEGLLKSIEDKQAQVKDMVARGKSLAEVKKAFGIEEETAQPGRRRWPSLVEVIYLDLTEKK